MKFAARIPAVLAFLLIGNVASAQFVWSGALSNDATIGTNWVGNVAPVGSGSEDISFGDGATRFAPIFPAATLPINNVIFNGTSRPAFTFTGSSGSVIGLAGSITVGAGSDVGINSVVGISLTSGAHTVTIATNVVTSVAGVISGSGGIAKAGAGTLVLSGLNTFSGGTTISAGSLMVTAVNALPTSSIVTTSGGGLDIQANQTLGAISGSSGGVAIASGMTLTLSGSSPFTYSGALTGLGTLAKQNVSIMTLAGTNTGFGGSINLSGGQISFSSGANLGTGTITLSGGTLVSSATTSASNNFVLSSSTSSISPNSATTLTLSGILSGSGALNKQGQGTLVLSGSNTFTGTTVISSGTLRTGAVNTLPTTTLVSVNQGTTFDVQNNQTIGGFSGFGGGTISIGSGVTLTVSGSSNSSFSSMITGAGGVAKAGSGTLTLNGSSSNYSGGLTISGGTLILGGSSDGSGNGPAGTGTVSVQSGGALSSFGLATLSNAVSLASGATLGDSSGDDLKFTGTVTVGGTATTVHLLPKSTTTFTGTLTGPGGTTITFDSGGKAIMTGTTSASITNLIADNAALVFFSNASLGSATLSVANNGYIGIGLNGSSPVTAATLLSRITNKSGFAGVVGFDFNDDLSGGSPVFAKNIDFSLFTNAAFRIGSTSNAIIAGTITPPSSGYAFGSSQEGMLVIDSNLSAATGVTIDSSGTGFVAVLRGLNSFTGNVTVTSAALFLDSPKAIPTGRTITLGGSFGFLGASDAFMTPQNFVNFAANSANVTFGSTTNFIGFIPHRGGLSIIDEDSDQGLTITGALDLNALPSTIYLGTFSDTTFSGAITAPGHGTLNLGSIDKGSMTISGILQAANVSSVLVGQPSGSQQASYNFNASNFYTGSTTLVSGTLTVNSSSGLTAGTPYGPIGTGILAISAGASLPAFASTSFDNGARASWASRQAVIENTILISSDLQLGQTKFRNDSSGFRFNNGKFSQLVLTGNISGGGGLKAANGRTILAGNNTYTGNTSSSGGALIFGAASAIPSSGTLTATSPGYIGTGFLPSNLQTDFLDRFNKASSSGTIGFDTIGGSNSFTGAGSANTFSANIDLTSFNSSARLGSATSAILSGTITPQGTSYRFGGGGGTLTVTSALTGSRSLIVDSSGGIPMTLRMAQSGGNTYTGSTSANQSAIIFASTALPGSSSFNLSSGSYIGTEDSVSAFSTFLNRFSTSISSGVLGFDTEPGGAQFTISSNLNLTQFTSSSPNFYIGSATSLLIYSSGSITLPGSATAYRFAGYKGGSVTVQTVLSGSNGVVIGDPNASATQGIAGTYSNVSLTGNNTYSGGTTLYAGQLNLGGSTSLGTGTLSTQSVNFFGEPSPYLVGQNSYNYTNALNLNADLDIGGSNYFTWSGVISGAAELTKVGTGTLTLTGNNTLTGDIYIKEGEISFATDSAAGLGSVELGGTLNPTAYFNSVAPVIYGLEADSSSDQVILATGTALTINQSEDTHFLGSISGSGSIVKTGSGELFLGGSDSYNGGTTINGGFLIAGHSGSFGSGAIVVNGGGIGTSKTVGIANAISFGGSGGKIGGQGSFNSQITAGNNVIITPGTAATTLGFGAGLVLGGGSGIQFKMDDASGVAGTGYSLIAISGSISGPATSLDITATSGAPVVIYVSSANNGSNADFANFNPASSYTWTLATVTNGISGFAANKFSVNVGTLTNNFNGGGFSVSATSTELQLNFTPVPEPSTWATLACGIAALTAALRRKRARGPRSVSGIRYSVSGIRYSELGTR